MCAARRPFHEWSLLVDLEADKQEFGWFSGIAELFGDSRPLYLVLSRQVAFQDENRAILRKHTVEFDERYVWD